MKVFQLLLITFLFKVGAYAENPEKPKPEDGKIVVGNSFTLSRDPNWNALIKMCKSKNNKDGKLSYHFYS